MKRETNLETSTAAAAAAAVDDDLNVVDEELLLDRGCARAAALGRSPGRESKLILWFRVDGCRLESLE